MCWWNVIRIYFNFHIFTNIFFELGNYSIRSLGTPLLNAAVYDATKKIPNPDQEDATTKTVFDKWLSSFPNVNDNLPRYFLSRQLLTQSLKFSYLRVSRLECTVSFLCLSEFLTWVLEAITHRLSNKLAYHVLIYGTHTTRWDVFRLLR